MKLPFRRKNDNSTVPAEIQEYYQTERRERTGIAWLLALGTLIITIGLATLLFFGGRWAYRAIVNNDDNQETAQVEENGNADSSDSEGNTAGDSTTGAPAQTGTSSTSTSTPNAPATTSTPGATQGSATSTPATGDNTLPNTGAGDVLSVFIAVTMVSALAYELRQRYFA